MSRSSVWRFIALEGIKGPLRKARAEQAYYKQIEKFAGMQKELETRSRMKALEQIGKDDLEKAGRGSELAERERLQAEIQQLATDLNNPRPPATREGYLFKIAQLNKQLQDPNRLARHMTEAARARKERVDNYRRTRQTQW